MAKTVQCIDMGYGRRWVHPKTEEVRFYIAIDLAALIGGLAIGRNHRGEMEYAALDGERIQTSVAEAMMDGVKVWYDKDGKVSITCRGARQ